MLQGDVDEVFLLCLRHVTKSHYYHLSVVSDYYLGPYRRPRQFCKTSAEVTNCVIAFCETMWEYRGHRNVDAFPTLTSIIREDVKIHNRGMQPIQQLCTQPFTI